MKRCEYGPINWLKPSWMHRASQVTPAIADATRLQDAVSVVFNAAFAESGEPGEYLQVECYQINDDWPLWQEDLTNRGGLPAKDKASTRSCAEHVLPFALGLQKLGGFIETALIGVNSRYEERAMPGAKTEGRTSISRHTRQPAT